MALRSLMTVAFYLGPCQASTLPMQRRQDDGNDEQNKYRRRAHQSVIQAGDRVYFEGGKIADPYAGDASDEDRGEGPLRAIVSLPLDRSWVIENASFANQGRATLSPALRATLWADLDEAVYYRWGGEDAFFKEFPAGEHPDVRSFVADGAGGLSWPIVDPGEGFDDIKATTEAASTQCGRQGFVIGGFGNATTDGRFSNAKRVPVPGIVKWDMDTNQWSNDSTAAITPDAGGTLLGAKAVCVEGSDEAPPLVFALGGTTTSATSVENDVFTDMKKVTFWDPDSREWYSQDARGDAVDKREHFCAVSARGSESHEIFVYGGKNSDRVHDDVLILTIPGFQWFRVNVTAPPRVYHACTAVGSADGDVNRRRQVLSTGGVPSSNSSAWAEDDPWPYSLGIFDMTDLEWKDEYDADAGDYETPDIIRNWYSNGGLDSVSWSSDAVKDKFLGSSSRSGNDTDSNSDSNANSDNGSSSSSSSSSSTPTAAIAGGVVGGLAGLAIVALAVWFLLRRRRRRQGKPAELAGEDKSTLKPPQIAGTPIQEADSRSPGTVSALSPTASELPSTSSRYELATDANAPTPQMRTELPG